MSRSSRIAILYVLWSLFWAFVVILAFSIRYFPYCAVVPPQLRFST